MELTGYISSAFESIFGRPCPRELMEASEGDARRYLKKVIENSGLAGELAADYGPGWAGEAFNRIRDEFVHKGCDVYFVPGLARILYGELDYDSPDQDSAKVDELRDLVKFISTAHKGDFSRNLEHITTVTGGPQKGMKVRSEPFTFKQLHDMFSREQKEVTDSDREALEKEGLTPNGYEIVELTDFDQASKYADYTNPDSRWCYLDDEETFEDYRDGGNRLYLALKPGFENLKPGDGGYGRSMIGFDMGPVQKDGTSRMCVCTNRYNHGDNLENEPGAGTGDSAYDEITLSKILGIPVWKACPGYTKEQLLGLGRIDMKMLSELVPDLATVRDWAENPGKYREKYGMYAEKTGFPVSTGIYKFINRRDLVAAYAFEERNSGKLLWTPVVGHLPEDRLLVKPFDRGYGIIDRKGALLTGDTLFDAVNSYHAEEFPIPVGRLFQGPEGMGYEWNYVDADGRLAFDGWLAGADRFTDDGYARIQKADGEYMIVDREMVPVVAGAENIREVVRDTFLVKKRGMFNFYSGGEPKFTPWLDCVVLGESRMLCMVSQECRYFMYNVFTDARWPESYWDVTKAGDFHGKEIFKVRRDEGGKYNYVVEDGSCRDSRPALDTWMDYAGSFNESGKARAMLDGQKYIVEFDGERMTADPVPEGIGQ